MATRTISDAGGNWNATGTWVEGAVPTSADDVVATATSGNLTINATAYCKSVVLTGYNAASAVTHNSGIGLAVAGNVTLTAGQYTAASGTAKITLSNTATLTTAGCLLGALIYNKSGGTLTLADDLSFRAGTGCVLTVQAGTLDLNGKTISGNSTVNRVWVRSATVGTSAAVTVSGGTFANADFMDIAFANGGADLDLSAITGLSGDCGGNSMSGGGTLTFTTGRVCNWTNAAGGNWSDAANWDTTDATDRVPLPQDDVTFDCAFNSGVTVLSDIPLLGSDIDWSSATWTGTAPIWGWTLATKNLTAFGSITCVDGLKKHGTSGFALSLLGRGSHTLYMATISVGYLYVYSGEYQLEGALTANLDVHIYSDSFVTNGYTVTTGHRFLAYAPCVVDLTDSTVVFVASGASNSINLANDPGITLTTTGSTLQFLGPYQDNVIPLGNVEWGNIVIIPSATLGITFSGNFSFADMSMSKAGSRAVKFTGGSSVTMTGDTFLTGTDGAPITITSTNTKQFTLSKSSEGYVSSDWLIIDYCTVDAATNWYAGANSIDGGHNGSPTWTFSAPPSGRRRLRRYHERLYMPGLNPGVM